MDPIEALRAIRTLIRVAQEGDDLETVRKLLHEMDEIVSKALAKPR